MTGEEILQKYRERFGEEPHFTGINFDQEFPIEAIWAAIQTGIPYIEDEIPEGIDM